MQSLSSWTFRRVNTCLLYTSALQKLAETFVFTSQGVPFIFAGDEMMRDKKGVHNSYNSPDSINTIDWKNKTVHKDVFEYVKGLIAMRKAHPAFRMGDADMVRRQLEFLPVKNTNVVAFILKDNACLLYTSLAIIRPICRRVKCVK